MFLVILTYPSLISQISTIVDRPLSTSSNRPLQEKSDSGDSSGCFSPFTESMAAEDEELIGKMAELECLSEDLKGFIAFVSPFNRVGILCT